MADESDAGSGSKQRVALDLAHIIHRAEYGPGRGTPENPRAYWLDLYAECLTAAYDQRAIRTT